MFTKQFGLKMCVFDSNRIKFDKFIRIITCKTCDRLLKNATYIYFTKLHHIYKQFPSLIEYIAAFRYRKALSKCKENYTLSRIFEFYIIYAVVVIKTYQLIAPNKTISCQLIMS